MWIEKYIKYLITVSLYTFSGVLACIGNAAWGWFLFSAILFGIFTL